MSRFNHANHVSIYDYPEHLNPFYEDEQHKRLRFWKIGSSKNRQSGQRRDSFTLGSLKDLLPLKSFRLKKKSSTLGVNKTSESPPPLRRGNGYSSEDESSRYATFDQRFDPNSESGFIRSARYRSSLQNMNNFNYENRNEPFRRTIQSSMASRNRTYGASLNGMTPGSSMNSISTNPFDDDTDNDSIAAASPSANHKRLRKKRQAPLPPVIPKLEPPEPAENLELRIDEDNETLKRLEELTRMTADFETFVKLSKTDLDATSDKNHVAENGSADVDVDEEQRVVTIVREEIVSSPVQLHEIREEKIKDSPKPHRRQQTKKSASPDVPRENHVVQPIKVHKTESTSYQLRNAQEVPKPRSREITPDYIPVPVREKYDVLRIDEDEVVESPIPIHPDTNTRQQNTMIIAHTDAKPLSGAHNFVEFNGGETEKNIVKNVYTINQINDVSPSINKQTRSESLLKVVESEIEEEILIQKERDELSTKPPITDLYFTQTPAQSNRHFREKTPMRVVISDVEKNTSNTSQIDEVSWNSKYPQSYTSSKVREETPIPVAGSEIEEKLTIQGFTRVEDPIKFYDDIETFLRKKEQKEDDDDFNQAEPPVPPIRRRSVKDIIESINRSQQLLRVSAPQFERKFDYDGQKLLQNKPLVPPKDKVLLKLSRQVENEKKVNELLADLQNFDDSNPSKAPVAKFPYDKNHLDRRFENHIVRDANNNPSFETK